MQRAIPAVLNCPCTLTNLFLRNVFARQWPCCLHLTVKSLTFVSEPLLCDALFNIVMFRLMLMLTQSILQLLLSDLHDTFGYIFSLVNSGRKQMKLNSMQLKCDRKSWNLSNEALMGDFIFLWSIFRLHSNLPAKDRPYYRHKWRVDQWDSSLINTRYEHWHRRKLVQKLNRYCCGPKA